jgi:sialic acid synthase
MYKKPIIIAEIGCNHKGDFEIAKQLVESAKKYCGVDIVKFQKRKPKELLTKEEYNAPHPNPDNSYGKTYGEHREFLEFTKLQHKKIKKVCEGIKVEYSTSVWDMTSAKEIVSLKPKFIKIPSACNLRFDLLDYLCKNYKGDIHISFGMTTKEEEEKIIKFFVDKKRAKHLIIYHCTSGYPVPFEELYLLEIKRLRESYGDIVKNIGFSGHHLGIAADIAAYALGANYFERHFTLDRTWKGTDHSASLEPGGMQRLVRDLNAVYKALSYKQKDISDIEVPQRKKLKRL